MARRRVLRRSMLDVGYGLNLTPLLDIIFNLIFFFILATNIREKQRFLEVSLPAATTAEERIVERQIPEVTLTREGTLYLDGTEMSPGDLQAELRRRVTRDQITEVLLSTDGEVTFQRFTDLTDIAREAGIAVVTPRMRPRTP